MRIYRPGRNLLPLGIWTAIVIVVAVFVETEALRLPKGSTERWIAQLGFIACMILGPGALIASLIRHARVSVSLDPERGVLLSGKRFIPWNQIVRVEHKAAPFKGGRNLLSEFDSGTDAGVGCAWFGAEGCFAGGPEGCVIGLALVIVGGLFYYILLPVFFLFSPWHSRVILHLANGDRIIYRDLEDDEDFARQVQAHLSRPE